MDGFDLFGEDYGLTSNISEGSNNYLHNILPNETMMDQAILVIQNWFKKKCNELHWGFSMLGSYPLKAAYKK